MSDGMATSSAGAMPSASRDGCVTATFPKRVIYFKGHKDERKSALITQLCKNYETVSKIFTGECATRTLLNLYNLHAVRGALNAEGSLVFQTSMSGPHHYFGWIDPRQAFTIIQDETGLLLYKQIPIASVVRKPLPAVPDDMVLRITEYEWVSGKTVDAATRAAFAVRDEIAVHLVDTSSGNPDSLFDNPGLLLLNTPTLLIPRLADPHSYDLSPFRAQVVPNSQPFSFRQDLVETHFHAQHKLRVVTYNYADRYLQDYLMHGSGVFIERHEFIQAITPLTPECGGFVMLGREVFEEAGKRLDIIACPIPYGFTLLVDVGSIHGDSTLTGLYMMAMTGNHNAMKTADTVFLKHRATHANVTCTTDPPLEPVPCLRGHRFHLTSDEKSLDSLRLDDAELRAKIKDSLGSITALWWQPVVATGTPAVGWHKTLGKSLP